jgi:hypothetical protein
MPCHAMPCHAMPCHATRRRTALVSHPPKHRSGLSRAAARGSLAAAKRSFVQAAFAHICEQLQLPLSADPPEYVQSHSAPPPPSQYSRHPTVRPPPIPPAAETAPDRPECLPAGSHDRLSTAARARASPPVSLGCAQSLPAGTARRLPTRRGAGCRALRMHVQPPRGLPPCRSACSPARMRRSDVGSAGYDDDDDDDDDGDGQPSPACSDRAAERSGASASASASSSPERPDAVTQPHLWRRSQLRMLFHQIIAEVRAGSNSSPPLAATSAPRLGPPPPHPHRDWAHPRHIRTGTGLPPPHPHIRWAHP